MAAAATTTTKSSDASISSSANQVGLGASKEDVVYYCFSVPSNLARVFSADSTLADIEIACKCSIMIDAKHHHQHQRPGESTIEVLMDEHGGDFAGSVQRLSELIRHLGGRWRIRRLIRRLSLANGSKKYSIEQPQPPSSLSPDSGHLDDSSATGATAAAAGGCRFLTPGSASSNSLVLSFADEAISGQWSLYSVVSPFLDLEMPHALLGQEITKGLWVHAVRLLAEATRQMATEAAAAELIAAASYARSASIDNTRFSYDGGDSPVAAAAAGGGGGGESSAEAAAAFVSCNYSHEPEPSLTLLVTALLCCAEDAKADDARQEEEEEDDDDDEDMIDTFVSGVSSTSNSLLQAELLNTERLSPRFAEPMPVTMVEATVAGRPDLRQPLTDRQQAQASISTCHTRGLGQLSGLPSRASAAARHTAGAASCIEHQAHQESGRLGRPLDCANGGQAAYQLTQQAAYSAVGGTEGCGSFGHVDSALPAADGLLLSCGLSASHPSAASVSTLAVGRSFDEAAASAMTLAAPGQTSGLCGGSATLLASSPCDAAPLSARKCSTLCTGAHHLGCSSSSSCQQFALPPAEPTAASGKSPIAESLLGPTAAEQCHVGSTGPALRHRDAPWQPTGAADRSFAAALDTCQSVACEPQPAEPLPPLLLASSELARQHPAADTARHLAQCQGHPHSGQHQYSVMSSAASGGGCCAPACQRRQVSHRHCSDLAGALRADDLAAVSPIGASAVSVRQLTCCQAATYQAADRLDSALDASDGQPAAQRKLALLGDHHRRLVCGPELTARPLAGENCPAHRLNPPTAALAHRQAHDSHGMAAHRSIAGAAAADAFELAPLGVTSVAMEIVHVDAQQQAVATVASAPRLREAPPAAAELPPPLETMTTAARVGSHCVRTSLDFGGGAGFAPVISCCLQRGSLTTAAFEASMTDAGAATSTAAYTLTFAMPTEQSQCSGAEACQECRPAAGAAGAAGAARTPGVAWACQSPEEERSLARTGCPSDHHRLHRRPSAALTSPTVELHCHCETQPGGAGSDCLLAAPSTVSLGARLAGEATRSQVGLTREPSGLLTVASMPMPGSSSRQHRANCPLSSVSLDGLLVAGTRDVRLNQRVVETSVALKTVCGGSAGGGVLIRGSREPCRHAVQAVCQLRVFEQQRQQQGLPDEWQQLLSLIGGAITALEWSAAWPPECLHAAAATSAAVDVAEALASRHKDPAYTVDGLGSGEVALHSELVWESRRRVQLAQSMLFN